MVCIWDKETLNNLLNGYFYFSLQINECNNPKGTACGEGEIIMDKLINYEELYVGHVLIVDHYFIGATCINAPGSFEVI